METGRYKFLEDAGETKIADVPFNDHFLRKVNVDKITEELQKNLKGFEVSSPIRVANILTFTSLKEAQSVLAVYFSNSQIQESVVLGLIEKSIVKNSDGSFSWKRDIAFFTIRKNEEPISYFNMKARRVLSV